MGLLVLNWIICLKVITILIQELRNREAELGEERSSYEKLCRGEDFISEKKRSKLICSYNYGHHPFMKLSKCNLTWY